MLNSRLAKGFPIAFVASWESLSGRIPPQAPRESGDVRRSANHRAMKSFSVENSDTCMVLIDCIQHCPSIYGFVARLCAVMKAQGQRIIIFTVKQIPFRNGAHDTQMCALDVIDDLMFARLEVLLHGCITLPLVSGVCTSRKIRFS